MKGLINNVEISYKAFLPTIKEVETIMISKLGYDLQMLGVKSNTRGYVYPRMIFSYICRKKGVTLEVIGKAIHRDHSTISGYLRNFESYYKSDKVFKILVDVIINA